MLYHGLFSSQNGTHFASDVGAYDCHDIPDGRREHKPKSVDNLEKTSIYHLDEGTSQPLHDVRRLTCAVEIERRVLRVGRQFVLFL